MVRRPKLPPALLQKPPFRFLFDVVGEVGRATGFGVGVFAPEGAGAPRDKDGKVAYLENVFRATAAALGEAEPARPLKVVAGLEPEETNEFLLQLARAARMGPGHPAVRAAMSGVQGSAGSVGGATAATAEASAPAPLAGAPSTEVAPGGSERAPASRAEETPSGPPARAVPAPEPEPEIKPRRMQRPQSARKAPPKPRPVEGEAMTMPPSRDPTAPEERGPVAGPPEVSPAVVDGIVSDSGAGLLGEGDDDAEEEVEVIVEASGAALASDSDPRRAGSSGRTSWTRSSASTLGLLPGGAGMPRQRRRARTGGSS